MARLPLLNPEDTSGDVNKLLEALPATLNIFRMMAHAETCVLPQVRLGAAILSDQELSHSNRELLILLVAQLEGGEYEWIQHVPIALGVGASQAQVDALEAGNFADAAFSSEEKALLAFGKEVIENVRVARATFAEVKAHFSDREVVETILAIGFYMTMARLTEATETDLDPAAGMTVFDNAQKQSIPE
jgi:alkylhydroperoxidase family enzyme